MSEFLEENEFSQALLKGLPMLDVRSEIEYSKACIPKARNLPLLKTEERARIGKCYKHSGRKEAIALGHKIVAGEVRSERIQAWQEFFKGEEQPILYCARGGLRSKISRDWLLEHGVEAQRVRGGYKILRRHLLRLIETLPGKLPFVVISGKTGSGKTELLVELQKRGVASLDLEGLANHRGSAFGSMPSPQPAQATFENHLAVELLKFEHGKNNPIYVEDESPSIGRVWLPASMTKVLCEARVIVLETSLEERAQRIISEYVSIDGQGVSAEEAQQLSQAKEQELKANLLRIRKRLGGMRYGLILKALENGFIMERQGSGAWVHQDWVKSLLEHYYDPRYSHAASKRERELVFSGNREEVLEFLTSK